MAKSRLIGDYPVIGIRPTIDGRRGPLKVRESLEEQTMNMAKSAGRAVPSEYPLFQWRTGQSYHCGDRQIGRVAEAQGLCR